MTKAKDSGASSYMLSQIANGGGQNQHENTQPVNQAVSIGSSEPVWPSKIVESSLDSHGSRLISGSTDIDLGCGGVDEMFSDIKNNPALMKSVTEVVDGHAFKICDLTDPSLSHANFSGNMSAAAGFTPPVGGISAIHNTGDEGR